MKVIRFLTELWLLIHEIHYRVEALRDLRRGETDILEIFGDYEDDSYGDTPYQQQLSLTFAEEDRLAKDVERFVEQYRKTQELIDSLEDPTERLALGYRHILCWDWEKIAAELQYSPKELQDVYQDAVLHAEKKYQT